ncbi:MAG: Asp-tRNA(Asn)/Glu-tRNA(Gln) amidotransferase subunit GatA [Acutalibacteraceae bacterium]|nr:Asp-tRNA(Asn)/Glu-tRNA(Gln) amidotransferase subunit GatA [Acutalibacteraceae bacterium]
MHDSMITAIHDMLVNKQISCTELTNKYLSAIEKENGELNAYVSVTAKTALDAAKAVDEKIAKGEQIGLLEGVPMTLKDNISTNGIETTCCSKILQGYKPIYDATVWDILKNEGCVMLGKTNMDEFAMGSSCETSCFGGAKNPHNIGHVAGGSSGGVASAVGANIAAFGLGSDTGGSIRQPAAFCGIVGFKPTYGAVSRYGLIAYASSLDQIGPITTTVKDAAIVYDAIAKKDKMDQTSSGATETATDKLDNDINGITIGVAREYFDGVRDDVKAAIEEAIKQYEKMGAKIKYFDMPIIKYALPVYYILACAEASSNLGRYDGVRYGYRTNEFRNFHEMACKTRSEGFGEEVKRRILLGTYVLSSGYYDAYYKKAQNMRGTIVKAFRNALSECDVLLAPTVPMTAFENGFTSKDAVETYLTDICTVPLNIAGLPGISIPCGVGNDGLPIGMQLIGNTFGEARLLNIAYKYEQNTDKFVKVQRGVEL